MRFFYIYRVVQLLKILIHAGLWLFCHKIHLKNKQLFTTRGPLLIIANHPNSFLDALIIGSYYKRRVYFLARGDAFKKSIHRFILESLNMIPVYRLREGKEYLHLNDYAFNKSINLLSKGFVVLIFIEGICINSNELQPFKKGTARILEGAQKLNIQLKIHIAGIAFNQFKGIGKTVNLVISEMTTIPAIQNSRDRVVFNEIVFGQLKQNILIPTTPTKFNKNQLFYKIHLPFYNLIKNFVAEKTKNTVFFDSVLFSVLLFTYPFFIISLFFILKLFQIPTTIIFVILVALPIMGKRVQE
jgi:1-acyl-sn-glycerol-3-phosphate acyltransferase